MQQLVLPACFDLHFPMWPFFEANVRPPIFLCSLQWSLPYQQRTHPRSQCYPDSRLFRFVHDITLDFHSLPRVRRLPIGCVREETRKRFAVPLWLFSCKRARIWICFYCSKKICSKKMIQNEFLNKSRGVQIQIHCPSPNQSHGTITTLSILGKQPKKQSSKSQGR